MKSQRISRFSQSVQNYLAESDKKNRKRLHRLNSPFYNDVVRSWSNDSSKTTRTQRNGCKKLQSIKNVEGNENTSLFEEPSTALGTNSVKEPLSFPSALEIPLKERSFQPFEESFKNFLTNVSAFLSTSQSEILLPKQKTSDRNWTNSKTSSRESWDFKRQSLHNILISNEAPDPKSFCGSCGIKLTFVIRCTTCVQLYCEKCDDICHSTNALHRRLWFRDGYYAVLPCNSYVKNGFLEERRVPVRVFVPATCANCGMHGTTNLVAGSYPITVITLQGRFDMYTAAFKCSKCPRLTEASFEDYISSDWWPGNPGSNFSTCLYSRELLRFWYLLKHHTPGTSEMKFLEILRDISADECRNASQNQPLFNCASREYEHFLHTFGRDIQKKTKSDCPACGKHPLSLHVDGNFKLYRYDYCNDKEPCTLLEDSMIKPDIEVSSHINRINNVEKQSRDKGSCGDSTYKAAKNTSSKFKHMDETGLIMASCRHGLILAACNMFTGENYRYIHFMHKQAYLKNVKFLCYDVVCRYWPFAERIGKKIPEFSNLTSEMNAFLSEMHGKTHKRECQLKYGGYKKRGAGLTHGEEQEQTNAKMSRYNNSTKYMGKTARNEHLCHGMWFWNEQKILKLPIFLKKRLCYALELEKLYRPEIGSCLVDMDQEEIYTISNDMIEKYAALQKSFQRDERIIELEQELENIYWNLKDLKKRIKLHADGSIARNALRKNLSDLSERAKEIINLLNDGQKFYKVTLDNFRKCEFPWLPLEGSKSFKQRYLQINTWMRWMRCKEEVELVRTEMKEFITSLLQKWENLKSEIQFYDVQLVSLNQSSTTVSQFLRGKIAATKAEYVRVHKDIESAVELFQDHVAFSLNDIDGFLDDEDILNAIEDEH